jgi:hypothetical protein
MIAMMTTTTMITTMADQTMTVTVIVNILIFVSVQESEDAQKNSIMN